MIALIDFNPYDTAAGVYYGGNAGAKNAILYEGAVWMLKFPKTTRDLINPQVSYTTSPLSEFIGSKIYEALGIPVHETLLGVRNGKMVVACKDFTRSEKVNYRLIPFHDLKNSFMSTDLEAYSGTGSETRLDEVLATIAGQDALKAIPGVTARFWDMFVMDAFIGNNDRNNGNWGILLHEIYGDGTPGMSLAPVFDNGNAFFNKRSLSVMESRLNDENAMDEDAYKTPRSAYKYTGTDTEGQRINPFAFIAQGENADCNAAVARFVRVMDFAEIERIIKSIPEVWGTLSVMPEIQKKFYLTLSELRYERLRRFASQPTSPPQPRAPVRRTAARRSLPQ